MVPYRRLDTNHASACVGIAEAKVLLGPIPACCERDETTLIGPDDTTIVLFPPWFTIRRQHKDYPVECAERARPLRIAVEFRNVTWLTEENRDETFEFLSGHHLAYVCVDTARRKGAVPAVVLATSSELAAVRFHGRARGRPVQPRPEQQYHPRADCRYTW
ncbi:MAG: DUF72 domain-containing protein [Gaiellales bacterium]